MNQLCSTFIWQGSSHESRRCFPVLRSPVTYCLHILLQTNRILHPTPSLPLPLFQTVFIIPWNNALTQSVGSSNAPTNSSSFFSFFLLSSYAKDVTSTFYVSALSHSLLYSSTLPPPFSAISRSTSPVPPISSCSLSTIQLLSTLCSK